MILLQMNVYRGCASILKQKLPDLQNVPSNITRISSVQQRLCFTPVRQFSSSPVVELMNKKIEISRQKTNKMLENAELQNVINIDALNSRETTHEELEGVTEAEAGSKEIFEIYPGDHTRF